MEKSELDFLEVFPEKSTDVLHISFSGDFLLRRRLLVVHIESKGDSATMGLVMINTKGGWSRCMRESSMHRFF
jgi:hypothetical protein